MDPSQHEIKNRRLPSRSSDTAAVADDTSDDQGLLDFKAFISLRKGLLYIPERQTGHYMSRFVQDWRLWHFNLRRKDGGYCNVEATDLRQVAWRAVVTIKGVTWRGKDRLTPEEAAIDADM